jgi:hypothetical protein
VGLLFPLMLKAETFFPLAGLDAQVLPKDRWEFRLGAKYTQNRWFPFESQNTHRKELWLPYLSLNIGVAENVELDFNYPYIYLDSDYNHSRWDSGDLSVRIIIRLFSSKTTFFSLNLETKLPNGDYNTRFSTNEADFFAEGLLTKVWGKLKIFINGGLGLLDNPKYCNSQDDILTFAGGFRYNVIGGLNLVWEVNGWAMSSYNNNYTVMTIGGQYYVSPHWRIDAGIHVGLNDESEDWGISAGLSYMFNFHL